MNAALLPSGIHVVQADLVAPQPWRNGGGQTRELMTWPADTDWQIRVSRADIDADGPFSAFKGVDRWFTVLEGEGVSLHFSGEQAADVTLKTTDAPLHFDGASTPGCTLLNGPTQDLNLMTRSGRSTMQTARATEAWRPAYTVSALYTACDGVWRASLADASNGVEAAPVSISLPAQSLLWCVAEKAAAIWTFTPGTVGARAWWLGYTPDAP